jgi:hypothetical protein
MADQRVNGNLILIGTSGGTVALGSQPSGGGYLFPTSIPQVGQNLVVASVYNGNTANLQWVNFAPAYQVVQQAGTSKPAEPRLNFLFPMTATDNPGNSTDIAVPVFVGSGASHAIGLVPDPGSTSGTTRFLREDSTWAIPADVELITSVFGRTGAVVAQSGDYSYAQISGTPQLPLNEPAVAHNFLTSYNSANGVFTQAQPTYGDISGTPQLAQTYGAVAHQWLNSYSATTGLFTSTQPAFSDLSGSVTISQISATGTPSSTTFLRGDGSWAVPPGSS